MGTTFLFCFRHHRSLRRFVLFPEHFNLAKGIFNCTTLELIRARADVGGMASSSASEQLRRIKARVERAREGSAARRVVRRI